MRWAVFGAAALLWACGTGLAVNDSQHEEARAMTATQPATMTLPALAFDAVDVSAEPVAFALVALAAGGDVHPIGGDGEPTTLFTVGSPPTAAVVPEQLTEAEMRAVLVAAGWPAELHDQALRVAWCESSWSPGALGDHGGSLGLFQVNALWFRYAGEDPGLWADPAVNARAALGAYHYSNGWRQWTCQP